MKGLHLRVDEVVRLHDALVRGQIERASGEHVAVAREVRNGQSSIDRIQEGKAEEIAFICEGYEAVRVDAQRDMELTDQSELSN